MALNSSWEQAICHMKNEGRFSGNALQKASLEKLEEEVEHAKKQLRAMESEPASFFSAEFHPACTELTQISETLWRFPPVAITPHVQVTGRLDDITPHGLFIWDDDSLESKIKALPSYLLYRTAFPDKSPNLLFSEGSSLGKAATFSESRHLPKFPQTSPICQLCLHTPCPHHYLFAKSLCAGNSQVLKEKIEKTSDPYWDWLKKRDQIDPDLLIANWSALLQEVFQPVWANHQSY